MQGLSADPARILVVDDERAVRELIARWLRGAGYDCSTADSPAAAWQQLQSGEIDLATLDITMPGGSGLDLLDRIKAAFPDTAAIMLTAEGDASKAIRALTAGAYGYLLKPVEPDELKIQVRNALERRRLVIENRDYTQRLEQKVREQTGAIRLAHEETIYRLVKASLWRDEETGAHIQRTGQ
ncbi:MAG TPA: response regulator [Pirellulales bacterium]|nr:response regulator [Pirellulales bacterium]